MDLKALIQKHSTAGPRYTSYPTAPQWNETHGLDAYRKQLSSGAVRPGEPLGLYVHIPFCEQLCYYCGCNIQITKDHGLSSPYIDALAKEIETAAGLLGSRRALSQISWGGGTPTFLSVTEIERLFSTITKAFDIADGSEISIEVDPRVTSDAQLECLRRLGFNRLSLGVQDFDTKVQQAINRLQSEQMTEAMLRKARQLGYSGINFDLIYGLPHQSLETFTHTIESVVRIRPDRIALYNYARLPTLLKHQKILEDYPMPSAEERVDIFTMAYDRLTKAGYVAIGMDHFAVPEDELTRAMHNGTLYRNFMGYTVKRGKHLLGVGASAIGEVGDSFFQNVKSSKQYRESVGASGLAAFRGCLLTEDDRRRKWAIQEIMCRFELSYEAFEREFGDKAEQYFSSEIARLDAFVPDGILIKAPRAWKVTALGRLFVRNVAMVFDAYLQTPKRATYSQTV